MKSLWDENEAKKFTTDLDLRVYTSRLLGKMSSLVLHGGGNTSVKSIEKNLFGEVEDILYVKGSGWDLATIEAEGFAPVKMDMLLKMAELKKLDDTNMVKYQRLSMTNPSAPNPSVEAILHAIIPFKFVDHTHANAIVTITNTKNGEDRIKELYGKNMLIIPYIMPGFALAKLVYEMTKDINWDEIDGMVLLNHGLFTFDNDAKKSYEKMIELVNKAEDYLEKNGAILDIKDQKSDISLLKLAQIRKEISNLKGIATISVLNDKNEAIYFSKQDINSIALQGPLTPDHVIRTKRIPVILNDNYKDELNEYVNKYKKYFEDNKSDEVLLNPAPNFAILKNNGTLSFGKNIKEVNIIKDINNHTFEAILKAQKLCAYKALSAKDIFDVEYWELEQAKLKKATVPLEFAGKIAIITGGANNLGIKLANELNQKGAVVIVLDINSQIQNLFDKDDILGIKCDLTSSIDINNAIEIIVKKFGGIDIVINTIIKNLDYDIFYKNIDKFLQLGIDSKIINVLDDKCSDKFNNMVDNNIVVSNLYLKSNQAHNEIVKFVSTMASNNSNFGTKVYL